jgi:hypothetical protein
VLNAKLKGDLAARHAAGIWDYLIDARDRINLAIDFTGDSEDKKRENLIDGLCYVTDYVMGRLAGLPAVDGSDELALECHSRIISLLKGLPTPRIETPTPKD